MDANHDAIVNDNNEPACSLLELGIITLFPIFILMCTVLTVKLSLKLISLAFTSMIIVSAIRRRRKISAHLQRLLVKYNVRLAAINTISYMAMYLSYSLLIVGGFNMNTPKDKVTAAMMRREWEYSLECTPVHEKLYTAVCLIPDAFSLACIFGYIGRTIRYLRKEYPFRYGHCSASDCSCSEFGISTEECPNKR